MKRILLLAAPALALSAPLAAAQPSADAAPAAAAAPGDNATRGARGHGKEEFLETYDANSDSVVSRAEFDAHRAEQFDRADADHNGALTEAEYVAEYQVRLDAELAAQREAQLRQAHVRFGVLDANHNAAMTTTEFGASGQRMFASLDTNHDGAVDERDTAEHY
jgi:hypothetical protein